MCGIFGYIGPKNPIEMSLAGLKRLEYRGYDSAGVAGVGKGELFYCKEVGKVAVLEKELATLNLDVDVAIAQTRWATHGRPSQVNAHPHFDQAHTLAIVHNGIIENHDALRRALEKKGIKFISETDTEVIAQLIGSLYEGDLLKSVKEATSLLTGSYAFALVHKDYPDQIIAIAHECPLVIGIGKGEAFVSSDPNAFAMYTREVIYLGNNELALIRADHVEIFDGLMGQVDRNVQQLEFSGEDVTKGDFEHYTLKEIHDQPQTIRNAMFNRVIEEYGTAYFDELTFDVNELLAVQRILILACGTSYHAGCIAAYMIEDMARIPVQVEISSEFRYKNPVVPHGTLAIAISQSGETADTIAAMRELKAKGVRVLAVCNVHGSTIVREADATLFLRAGPEIGVCSTKAYTNQVIVLALFNLLLARMRHMGKEEGQRFLDALRALPDQVQKVLHAAGHIQALAKKYSHYENFFFLGRLYMFPTSLEGALKLKEISYINANGYAAGEMKHGPIALINPACPTVAMCANAKTYDKLLSNLMEVKARSGLVLAIAQEGEDGLHDIADDIIYVPRTIDELATVPSTVAAQLLAYYIAKERGADIDQPRNLAKSVTVE